MHNVDMKYLEIINIIDNLIKLIRFAVHPNIHFDQVDDKINKAVKLIDHLSILEKNEKIKELK